MKFRRGLHVPVEQLLKVSAMLLDRADMLDDGITGDFLFERFQLCLDNDFHSKFSMSIIIDTLYIVSLIHGQ